MKLTSCSKGALLSFEGIDAIQEYPLHYEFRDHENVIVAMDKNDVARALAISAVTAKEQGELEQSLILNHAAYILRQEES